MDDNCFTLFKTPIDAISLPEKFTFPFYYRPHKLALLAAQELQKHISDQHDWAHNFGIKEGKEGKEGIPLGKMFGVLVVKNSEGEIGYLSGFSGALAGRNIISGFVPPIYDRMEAESYFKTESEKSNAINSEIEKIESSQCFDKAKKNLDIQIRLTHDKLKKQRDSLKVGQRERRVWRQKQKELLFKDQYQKILDCQQQESINDNFLYKEYNVYLKTKLAIVQQSVDDFQERIIVLKEERKARSILLQKWLFDQYRFVNKGGDFKSVVDIFKGRTPDIPPAGAGDCAAPKLIQYAFTNKLEPIVMAEFWWGKAPSSKIRKHGYFYPSCKGKCEPILGYMLEGMDVDPNPMLINPAIGKKIETIYEDEFVVVINKPAEFLSVPGKNISDSVQERMKLKYPNASGPLIVHRLDMSTSGIMIIALSKEIHKNLQRQFIKRTIIKRYIAILDGVVKGNEGYIDLPIRVDLDNRPCQLVCYEYGKSARTKWEVIAREQQRTRIQFHPITGRTHQLRVHAAYEKGLNAPIFGDDLYGIKGERLHLHAEAITFVHPITKESMSFQVDVDF